MLHLLFKAFINIKSWTVIGLCGLEEKKDFYTRQYLYSAAMSQKISRKKEQLQSGQGWPKETKISYRIRDLHHPD